MNGAAFWDDWYAAGGDSGPGSRGEAARFKADTVNDFVHRHGIRSVFESGCGDGGQLALLNVPAYTGYDVSNTALARAQQRFRDDPTKVFVSQYEFQRADLALSMDVLYHLFDDAERAKHLATLFTAGDRFVMIYTTRDDSHDMPGHVWHRPPPDGWTARIDSPDPLNNCSFFVYPAWSF